MATLEKIRSKSVMLFVIIIVALLAFILGDFLTSGRTYFGSGTTMAEAKGKKVDLTLYQQQMERASEQARNYNQNVDNDELAQNVIQGLLGQELLKQEFEDLGLRVSDNEISEAMTGVMPHPAAQQFIYTLSQNLGFDRIDGKGVLDAIKNPAKYNLPPQASEQLAAAWAQTEKDVEDAILQQKFYGLVQGLYSANQLDARSLYDDNAATRHISYATKGYNTLASDDVKVDDADLKAAWEKDKNAYRLDEETRVVDYIYVVIEPSSEDRLAGQQAVENAIIGLNATEGLTAIEADSRFVATRENTTASRITDKRLRDFLTDAENGQAEIITNSRDSYQIAKRFGTTEEVDSINVSVLALRNPADADSLVGVLKGGAAWTEFVETADTQGQDSMWVSLVGTNLDSRLRDAWLSAAVGVPTVINDTVQGQPVAQIFRVNRRHAPVTVYDYAVINYTVDPSAATLEKLNNDLRTFVSANSSGDDFSANATEAGYAVLPANVSNSSAHIANVSDSRPAVKWVMNAKKGQVSPVIGDSKQTYLMAIAVKDIYNDFIPWNSAAIRSELERKVTADKAGQALVAQFEGKANDVASYAQLFGGEVSEGDVIFVSPRVATIGIRESALQGAIAGAPQGKVVGPLAANNSIVVFRVDSISDESRPYTFDEYAQRFNRTMGLGTADPFKMLLGNNKVKNHSLNFIQGLE